MDVVIDGLFELISDMEEADDRGPECIVHDLASSEASNLNNGGKKEQLEYMVAKLGAAEATSMIREVIKQAKEA